MTHCETKSILLWIYFPLLLGQSSSLLLISFYQLNFTFYDNRIDTHIHTNFQIRVTCNWYPVLRYNNTSITLIPSFILCDTAKYCPDADSNTLWNSLLTPDIVYITSFIHTCVAVNAYMLLIQFSLAELSKANQYKQQSQIKFDQPYGQARRQLTLMHQVF